MRTYAALKPLSTLLRNRTHLVWPLCVLPLCAYVLCRWTRCKVILLVSNYLYWKKILYFRKVQNWILNRIRRGIGSVNDFSSTKDVEDIGISWINHKSFKYKTKCLNGKARKVQTDIDLKFTLCKGSNPCLTTCRSATILKSQNHPVQVEKGNKNFVDTSIYLQ